MAMPCGNEDGFFIVIVTLPAFAVALFFVNASLPFTASIFSLVAAVATPATVPPVTTVTRTATAARRGETNKYHNLLVGNLPDGRTSPERYGWGGKSVRPYRAARTSSRVHARISAATGAGVLRA